MSLADQPSANMTLRQWYAGVALQGMLTIYQVPGMRHVLRKAEQLDGKKSEDTMAKWAVAQADALLAALEETAPHKTG